MAFLGFMTVREHEAVVGDAKRELEQLATSIWRAEYRHDAPEWQPLPDLRGLVSQVDNMYAGVRSQRDVQTDRANKLTEQMRWADNQTRAACAERDALAAELATLKAERDRRLAPLAAANAARKAKAQAARGGDVREGV